jgi:glutathione synthase/RimK-type ligase-like ATP-grasp enzyme
LKQKNIIILTITNDLHALTIQKELQNNEDIRCEIVEIDRIAESGFLNWSNIDDPLFETTLPCRNGSSIDIKNIHLIWLRRINYPQKVSLTNNSFHLDLINNDCKESLLGILFNEFRGKWINHPLSSRNAENKLIQLEAATRAGFRTPLTLVSQDPKKIKMFCLRLDNNVIVKPVSGTNQYHLFTRKITSVHLENESNLKLCPAIYQEYIDGKKHIRAHCFGSEVYSFLIESNDIDWRENLNNLNLTFYEMSSNFKNRLLNVIDYLGLEMGVIDLKLDKDEIPIWLEINPQGQFLFIEGLTGFDMTSTFADFLYRKASNLIL